MIVESCYNVSVTIPMYTFRLWDYITIDKAFVFILLQLLMVKIVTGKRNYSE